MSSVTPWPGSPPAALLADWGAAPELELGPALLLSGITALDGVARALQDGEVDLACRILVMAYPTEDAFQRYYGLSWRDAAAVLHRAMTWAEAHPTWETQEAVLWTPLLRVYERLGFCDGVSGLTERPAHAGGPGAPLPEVPPSAAREGLTWRISVGIGRTYDRARARGAAEALLRRDAPDAHVVLCRWARRLRRAVHQGQALGALRRRGQRALTQVASTLPDQVRSAFDRVRAAWVRDSYRWEAAATTTAVHGSPCTMSTVWHHWQRHRAWRAPATGAPTRAARAMTAELRLRLAAFGIAPDALRAAEDASGDTALHHLRTSDHGGAAQVRHLLAATHRRIADSAFLGTPAVPFRRSGPRPDRRAGASTPTSSASAVRVARPDHGPMRDVAQLRSWMLTSWPQPWPIAPSVAFAAAEILDATSGQSMGKRSGQRTCRRPGHPGAPLLPPSPATRIEQPETEWSATTLAATVRRARCATPPRALGAWPDLVTGVRAERECVEGGAVTLLGIAEQWVRGYALEATAHREESGREARTAAEAMTWAAQALDAALDARATAVVMTTIVQQLVGHLPGGYTAPDARPALLALVRAEAPRLLRSWDALPGAFAERCRRRAGYDVLAWLLDEWALITLATTPEAGWPGALGGDPPI